MLTELQVKNAKSRNSSYMVRDDKPLPQPHLYGLLSEQVYYGKQLNFMRKKVYKYDSDGKRIGEEVIK